LEVGTDERRSGCPINLALEVLGDHWSLLVIRDLMFGNRRHVRGLLGESEEGIASNILTSRLKRLFDAGLISRRDDVAHKQKGVYSLTEPAIALVLLLAHVRGMEAPPSARERGAGHPRSTVRKRWTASFGEIHGRAFGRKADLRQMRQRWCA
jgi:DNA-binding HxlR family transcriptional regulator